MLHFASVMESMLEKQRATIHSCRSLLFLAPHFRTRKWCYGTRYFGNFLKCLFAIVAHCVDGPLTSNRYLQYLTTPGHFQQKFLILTALFTAEEARPHFLVTRRNHQLCKIKRSLALNKITHRNPMYEWLNLVSGVNMACTVATNMVEKSGTSQGYALS